MYSVLDTSCKNYIISKSFQVNATYRVFDNNIKRPVSLQFDFSEFQSSLKVRRKLNLILKKKKPTFISLKIHKKYSSAPIKNQVIILRIFSANFKTVCEPFFCRKRLTFHGCRFFFVHPHFSKFCLSSYDMVSRITSKIIRYFYLTGVTEKETMLEKIENLFYLNGLVVH